MIGRRSALLGAAGWTIVGASSNLERLRFETERWTKVVKENNIKIES